MPAHDARPIVVTGASKGIGRATALHLDQRGFRVFAGVRTEADSQALREGTSDRLTPVMLEVTDQDAIAAAAALISEEAPAGLAGVVNNAGIVIAGPLECLPLDEFRLQLEVNVTGALAVAQAFLPLLRAGRGRLVNVSSINGCVAVPFAGAYAASKFALEAVSDALRMELRHWKIPVSVIQPGAIRTPIWKTATQRAQKNLERFPTAANQLYGRYISAMSRRSGAPPKHAIPPQRVARVIERALTARRPRTRYLIGIDAHAVAFLSSFLPDRLMDKVLAR